MNRPEQDLQRIVVEWLNLAQPHCIWFAVPNGGWRSKTEAAIMKGLGVQPGVADLVFAWQDGKVGFIELKSQDGKRSRAQWEFQRRCIDLEIPYLIARSLEEVTEALKGWQIPLIHEIVE